MASGEKMLNSDIHVGFQKRVSPKILLPQNGKVKHKTISKIGPEKVGNLNPLPILLFVFDLA